MKNFSSFVQSSINNHNFYKMNLFTNSTELYVFIYSTVISLLHFTPDTFLGLVSSSVTTRFIATTWGKASLVTDG